MHRGAGVLVVGGGFLGSHLVAGLAAEGARVTVLTRTRPQDGAAHRPAGAAWRSASSTARARQEEVRNQSAQGASSPPSTCTCQPDVPPWLVSRGGCARPESR